MLTRLLATLTSGRSYLDIGSDLATNDMRYWQAMAEINCVILSREGLPLNAIRASVPVIQDLARVLTAARRTGA
jgi:hypothetical protein